MSEKEGAERACKEPNPIIDGRKANVNLAILGAKPRANITGGFVEDYWSYIGDKKLYLSNSSVLSHVVFGEQQKNKEFQTTLGIM